MSTRRIEAAKVTIATKQLALELVTQFIDKNESRLNEEQWHVPRFGSKPIIVLGGGLAVEAAFEIARRWPDVPWVLENLGDTKIWRGVIEGVTLAIDYVIGRQPVDSSGEMINLFPDQVDNKAGESGIENQTHQSEVKQ